MLRIVSKRKGQAGCDNGERFIKVSFFIVLIGECELILGGAESRGILRFRHSGDPARTLRQGYFTGF